MSAKLDPAQRYATGTTSTTSAPIAIASSSTQRALPPSPHQQLLGKQQRLGLPKTPSPIDLPALAAMDGGQWSPLEVGSKAL